MDNIIKEHGLPNRRAGHEDNWHLRITDHLNYLGHNRAVFRLEHQVGLVNEYIIKSGLL